MRVEPFAVDSFVHAIKRGSRGLELTVDESDKSRFLRLLFYMNDEFLDEYWYRADSERQFFRPDSWPERKPLVAMAAYTLMPNHFHLLLQEIREGGISSFMKKLSQSMTNYHNEKYDQKGSIFQGSYRGKTIDSDEYLRYVAAYIMVKNTFELYPHGGLQGGVQHFENAWQWAIEYRFSSLGDYAKGQYSPILEKRVCGELFSSPREFKKFARDVIAGGKWRETELE